MIYTENVPQDQDLTPEEAEALGKILVRDGVVLAPTRDDDRPVLGRDVN